MFSGCYVGFYGGYLGRMAKLRPFCRRDNCSLVGGLERFITHLLVQSVHVWLVLEGGSPGAGFVSTVLMEGVGAMGVAGMLVEVEVVVEVLEILDGMFGCPLKVFGSLCLFPMVSTHICPKYTPNTPLT